MRRAWVTAGLLLAGLTVAGLVVVTHHASVELAGRVWLDYLVAVLLYQLVRSLGSGGAPEPVALAPGRGHAAGLPSELIQANDLLRSGSANQFDFETKLRPLLREIAQDGLERRGISLVRDPQRAAAELGPLASELLLPEDSGSPGLRRGPDQRLIAATLDRLESFRT